MVALVCVDVLPNSPDLGPDTGSLLGFEDESVEAEHYRSVDRRTFLIEALSSRLGLVAEAAELLIGGPNLVKDSHWRIFLRY